MTQVVIDKNESLESALRRFKRQVSKEPKLSATVSGSTTPSH